MNPAGRVTLPAEVRRALDLGDEAMFEVQVQRGAIVLRPPENVAPPAAARFAKR